MKNSPVVVLCAVVVCSAQSSSPAFRYDQITPESLTAAADQQLAASQPILDRILAVTGPRTIENTLQPYDDLSLLSSVNFNFVSLVHPDARIRAAASKEFARLRAFRVALNQNRALYDAINAIDLRQADGETRYYVERLLDNFRRATVDRDEGVRRTIEKLQADVVRLQQEFQANLRQRGDNLTFASPSELDGMPADWLARQQRGSTGEVIVTQGWQLLSRFARNPSTRERAAVHGFNQARANHDTLTHLLKARHELAKAHGYSTAAEFLLNDHMAQSPARVIAFLDSLRKVYEPPMRQTHASAVAMLRDEMPGLTALSLGNYAYAARRFREDRFKLDVLRLREYFPYARVRDGVFTTVRELFGLEFREVKDAPVWHPSVETYDVVENGRPMARVYLDVQQRDGNIGGPGAMHPIRIGPRGKVLPEVAITANFKSGRSGDPDLMEPMGMQTFFHEMGHAVHHILATRKFAGTSGPPVERDFVEAPSNFFSEWSREPRVLNSMARHYKTGMALTPDLVAMIKKMDDNQNLFRLPIAVWQSYLSLALHNQPTPDVDVDAIVRQTMKEHLPYTPPVPVALLLGVAFALDHKSSEMIRSAQSYDPITSERTSGSNCSIGIWPG